MVTELNNLKKDLNFIKQCQNEYDKIEKVKNAELKNYVTFAGITKAFIPLDIVTLVLSAATMNCGDIRLGSAILGVSIGNLITKFCILKRQKKNISRVRDEIALGKLAKSVNQFTELDIKQQIDEYTEKIYADEEPSC